MTGKECYKGLGKRPRLDAATVEYGLLPAFMADHGLLPQWRYGVFEARDFFGGVPEDREICNSAGGCIHENKCIYVSVRAIKTCSPAQIKDVILHEIAHALVPRSKDHGYAWQIKAAEIGVRKREIIRYALVESVRPVHRDRLYRVAFGG